MATLDQLMTALRNADASGNTEDARQLALAIQQMQSQPSAPAINPTPGPSAENPPTGSFAENTVAGFGKSFVDTGERLGQLGLKQLNAETFNSIPAAVNAEKSLQATIDEQARLNKPLNDSGGGMFGEGLGLTAQLALPMGEGAKMLEGVNALTKLAVPGAVANEVTQPTGEGRLSEVSNPLVGALGSTVGGVVGKGFNALARAGSEAVDPLMVKAADYLRSKGVPLSLDQITEHPSLQFLRSLTKDVPMSSGRAFENEQKATSTETVSRLFGENADALTDDVLNRAQTRIGNDIARVVPDQHTIPLEKNFYDSIQGLIAKEQQSVSPNKQLIEMGQRILGESEPNPAYQAALKQTQGWSPQAAQQVLQGIPQTIVKRPPLFQGDVMTGAQYRAERTDLGRKMYSAYKAGDHETGRALEAMQETLDNAANETLTGAEQQGLNTARQQYRNLMTVVPAVKNGVKGELDIDALNESVKRRDPEAYNFGRGPNAETAYTAKALKSLLGQPASTPTWGKRLLALTPVAAGLGSVYTVGGPVAAGATAVGGSRAMNALLQSPGLQRYITQGAGPTARNILEFLARGSQPVATSAGDAIADRVAQ